MGLAIDSIGGNASAPGTTFTALTMNSGDSATIRNAALGSDIFMVAAWMFVNATGTFRIHSPKLHDNTKGIHFLTKTAKTENGFPLGIKQKMFPQDNLTLEITGSSTAGQLEEAQMLIYYADLPGAAARLITTDILMRRMVNLVTVENDLTAGTAGGYSGGAALNATDDLLIANTDYALLGYTTSLQQGSINWRGADTANLRVSGPGEPTDWFLTSRWFMTLAQTTGLPCIAIFNAANKAGITIDVMNNQAAASPKVVSIFAQLGPG